MKAFRIGSSGWEIYGEHVFTHENKSKEEFNEDCRKVLRESLQEFTDELKEEDDSKVYLNAFELMERALPKLKELGYESLEFEGDYTVPGSDLSYMSNDEATEESIKEFGKDLFETFVNKAKKIERIKYS